MPSHSADASAPTSPARRNASSASRRRVLCLAGATLLVMTPVTLIVPGLKELIADRYGASDFWTHGFMAFNLLGAMLAFPVIARACDHVDSRVRIAALALAAEAALFGVMAAAPNLVALFAARTLEGAAHMLALSALMAAAADDAPPPHRGRVMGLIGACMMFGTAAGTRLGGELWKLWPGRLFEMAAGVALLAAGFILMTLRDVPHRREPKRIGETLALLRRNRALWIAYSFTFVERLCVGVIITSFVLLLGSAHSMPPEGRSRLLFAFLFPFAMLTYPAGRLADRIGCAAPLTAGSVGFGIVLGAYGFASTGWLLPLMLLSGLLSALMFAPTLSLCAALSPGDQRGAAYAGFNIAGALGMICGPILGGIISQIVGRTHGAIAGYQWALAAAGGMVVVVAIVSLPWLVRLRREGRIR